MDSTGWLVVILGVSSGSFLLRATPFLIGSKVKFHPKFLEWLVLLAISIISGIISKSLFISNGSLRLEEAPGQIGGLVVAGVLQKLFGNLPISLVFGIASAMLIKAFLA
jgi:branched-subunit amino acid transport protein